MVGEEEEKKRLRPNAQGRVPGPQALGGSQQLLLCDLHVLACLGAAVGKRFRHSPRGPGTRPIRVPF